jgi:hypothetical protein
MRVTDPKSSDMRVIPSVTQPERTRWPFRSVHGSLLKIVTERCSSRVIDTPHHRSRRQRELDYFKRARAPEFPFALSLRGSDQTTSVEGNHKSCVAALTPKVETTSSFSSSLSSFFSLSSLSLPSCCSFVERQTLS